MNIAVVSTIIGGTSAFCLCFFAATNLVGAGAVRWVVRRIMEVMRAFPEIVIAGLLTAILSIGPIAAIAAVSLHTVGALGKLFFEVVENADMKPDEGLQAVGATWLERVRFAIVPQVMPNFVSYASAAHGDQRARLDHYRRGGRRRHRRGVPPVDRARLRGARPMRSSSSLLVTIIAIDQFSGWLRGRLVGDASLNFGKASA